MNVRGLKVGVVLFFVCSVCVAVAANAVDEKTEKQAQTAISSGMEWLERQQTADGRLGPEKYPAITALALSALKAGGSTNSTVIAKAEKYVKTFSGGKYADPMLAHNAEICRKLVRQTSDDRLQSGIGGEEARRQAAALRDVGDKNTWARERAKIDREYSISAREVEIRQAEWQRQRAELAKQHGGDPDRLMAERVATAVMAVQTADNRQQTADNRQQTADNRLQTTDNRRQATDGKQQEGGKRRGYGSLSYEGMMNLLDDRIAADDPRVDAMLDWAERGWNLNERVGGGRHGLYYFYHVMAKCLNAGGENEIKPLFGSGSIHWREEMIRKLISLQKKEASGTSGFWVNSDPAYMENDPVLVTAYALLTLECALGTR